MKINKLSTVLFSPTESTKEVLMTLAGKIPLSVNVLDVTCYSERTKSGTFAADELVIFGVPVYGGRVPAPAVERIKRMHGNETPAILVVTYGNRAYEDVLLELKNLVEQSGFVPVAAAAFVAEHSIMHSLAKGRPDTEDTDEIIEFANTVWEKIKSADGIFTFPALEVKGNSPYREYNGVPMKPQASKACKECGICAANCPVNAIPAGNPNTTKQDVCITCMRCIKVCPSHARGLDEVVLSVAEKSFGEKFSARKEPEIFI